MNQKIISRSEVANALNAWPEGKMCSQAIHDWANELFLNNDVEYEDWEGDDSITNEVLGALDMLDMNLVLPEDAPIYLQLLATPKGDFVKGYAVYQQRLEGIDYEARKEQLRDNPLYAPFLKGQKD